MKKIGLLVGKFLPLHNGHLYFINKAATEVDLLYVIVDEHPINDRRICEESKIKYPDLLTRVKWMTSIFKDTPHIKILAMSEENIPEYPNGWKMWADKIKETINDNLTHIFTSDISYKDGFNEYFPTLNHVFYNNDREETNGLSSTQIRSNLFAHWGDMPSIVREFFVKKICVIGAESTGKTTLVRAMSKAFATSWSEECGRILCELELGSWTDKNGFMLTNEEDYYSIVNNQEIENKKAYRTANKFVLIDTDAIYTQNFFVEQFGHKSEFIEQFIKKQKNEFIYIYLNNNVPFVKDGNRTGKTRDTIKDFYKSYGIKFDYEISEDNYKDRFNHMFKILKGIINEN